MVPTQNHTPRYCMTPRGTVDLSNETTTLDEGEEAVVVPVLVFVSK